MPDTPRGPDRRQAPRRAEDARLHYAREALLGQALEVAALMRSKELAGGGTPLALLLGMADVYLDAEADGPLEVTATRGEQIAVATEAMHALPLSPDVLIDPAKVRWSLVQVSVPMDPPGVYGDEALVRVVSAAAPFAPILTVRYDGTIEQEATA